MVERHIPALDIIYLGTLPPHPGGTGIVGYQLLDCLATDGHQIRAIAPLAADRPRAGLVGTLNSDVQVHWYEVPYPETNLFTPPPPEYRDEQTRNILDRVAHLIAAQRPDLILLGRGSFIWGIPDIAKANGIPLALWVHSPLREEAKRDLTIYDGDLLPALSHVDQLITCADHLVADYRTSGFGAVASVANGVDIVRFQPRTKDAGLLQAFDIGADAPVVVHASNLNPIKRPLDVVDCALALRERRPDLVWLILGTGPGQQQMTEAVEAAALGDRFRFAGWIDHRRMADHVNLADVAVMPSQDECMALSYLEGMACAVPVVASDLPASREALRHGQTGLLHGIGDIAAMAGHIAGLIEDGARRAALGQAARQWVVAHHDMRQSARRFAEILSLVAARR